MKRFGNILSAISIAALLLCSCSIDERLDIPDFSGNNGVELSFTGDPMSRYKVRTKASDPKEEDEKRINQLYIFFFTQEGEYLDGTYLEGYPNASARERGGFYAPGEGVMTLKIANDPPDSYFTNPSDAKDAIVYALANVDPDVLGLNDLDANGRPKSIPDMDALENMFYTPYSTLTNSSSEQEKQILWSIPAGGMPMAGKKTVDLTQVGSGSENAEARTIELKALMSRIDVNIRLETEDYEAGLPRLTMIEWTTLNMPAGVKIGELDQDPNSPGDDYTELAEGQKISSITREQYRQISNNNGEISLTFYMFENSQPPVDYTYPDDVKEEEKQRYKPELANEDAAAIRLHCNYATYNDQDGNATYDVNYTLYLGANHTDDFTVRRNHQYKNDIVIKGLIHHSDVSTEDAYSFDARVNIDHDNNKYHIAILRERNHDAHFCVTPMDVYLFADESLNPRLTVTIDEDSRRWLGMELITAADMEAGTVSVSGFIPYTGSDNAGTHLATGTPWTAGNGKRAFFTTSLFPKDGYGNVNMDQSPLKNALEVGTNRDRIYFYLDENIDTNDDGSLKLENRTATVTLTYSDDETPAESRTLLLEQVHLLPIRTYQNNAINGSYNEDEYIRTIYMEQIEEYLNHYDPLDLSTTPQMYDGLAWADENSGLNDFSIPTLYANTTLLNPYDAPFIVIHDGFEYTAFAIYLLREEGGNDPESMTLNGVPTTAFQYCWNKNIRNNDNKIGDGISHYRGILDWFGHYHTNETKGKWFLPGIRQMEQSLLAYYSKFAEFQGNFYWSSSAAEAWGETEGQNPQYARATKIDEDGEYIESGGNRTGNWWGDNEPWLYPDYGGYAPRTEDRIRIRAFRIDLEPYDY